MDRSEILLLLHSLKEMFEMVNFSIRKYYTHKAVYLKAFILSLVLFSVKRFTKNHRAKSTEVPLHFYMYVNLT